MGGIVALFFIVLVSFAIFVVYKGVLIVQQGEAVIIERLGEFKEVLSPGLHIIIPGLERPRVINWKYVEYDPEGNIITERIHKDRIELRERVYNFPRQRVITSDNVNLTINGVLYYQVVDPKRAVYEVENLPDALEKIAQTSLRDLVGRLTLDETFASRGQVNEELRKELDVNTDKWGVKVNRVEVLEIITAPGIEEAMNKEMRAERGRRAEIAEAEGIRQANILKSEGERQAMVNRAKGEREATILRADAQADALLRIARAEERSLEAVSNALKGHATDPTQYLVAMRYIEALKKMMSGGGNRVVFMPYEATGLLGSLGSIKEIFKEINDLSK